MNSKICIIEKENGTPLYTFEVHQAELAYKKALELEELEIDFIMNIPSTMASLCQTLGLPKEKMIFLENEIQNEIQSHE